MKSLHAHKASYWFFAIFVLLTVAYVGGCRNAGRWLVKETMPTHADAIVLLMGNFPDRVLQTVDLWHEERACRIIIVEESMGPFKRLEARLLHQMADSAVKASGVIIMSNTEQAANSLVTLGIPADSITILPGDARSTIDEALVVRDYLAEINAADTILLVSSAAHMRRASMMFKKAFKESGIPIYVGCSPSAYSSFNPDRWWRRKEDVQQVLTELVKIASFILVEQKQLKSKI